MEIFEANSITKSRSDTPSKLFLVISSNSNNNSLSSEDNKSSSIPSLSLSILLI